MKAPGLFQNRQRRVVKIFVLSLYAILACASPFLATNNVSALSGSEFKAGRIIDDALFFNGNAMSATQVQSFLNSKVPTCDTNGTKAYAGTTRAAYGTSRGYPPPYTCLKNYKVNTPSRGGESGLCGPLSAKSNRTAAQIIDDVARTCGVSQKALIILLEKEQSLVTDDWPWSIQYRSATGYGCPDTAPCDSEYYGFFNQVYNAARQFKRYKADADYFNHRPNRTSYIQYNPNASCGGSNVYIQNQATAGLYNYTPYQPNSSALSNLYGSGNSCSAYGNRNFWRLFNDWFGSTSAKCTANDRMGARVFRLFSVKKARHYYTAFECEANQLDATSSYRLEGVEFSQIVTPEPNISGVFRLKRGTKWFWTIDPIERDNLVSKHKYRLEGTAFIGLTAASTNATKLPVYRLYNSVTGGHLWTTSIPERNKVDAQKSWRYEGIAYYMLPPS